MTDFVRYTLEDGSQVVFESAESGLVEWHGGPAGPAEGGRLQEQLKHVSSAASEVAEALRSRLTPDEVELKFGLKVSGEASWFFAKSQAEGTIEVTLRWAADAGEDQPQ